MDISTFRHSAGVPQEAEELMSLAEREPIDEALQLLDPERLADGSWFGASLPKAGRGAWRGRICSASATRLTNWWICWPPTMTGLTRSWRIMRKDKDGFPRDRHSMTKKPFYDRLFGEWLGDRNVM